MKLSIESLKDKEFFKTHHIHVPQFDYQKVQSETKEHPQWIHFGVGNIFRGFIAKAQQELLNKSISTTGIIAVESFDFEIIDRIYRPYDNLTLLATMHKDGTLGKAVVGSIVESLTTRKEDWDRIVAVFENPSLQMVSFTITEKGYSLKKDEGESFDFEHPTSMMSLLTKLLYKRFERGGHPLSVVSMDNCSNNGELLQNAVITVAEDWVFRSVVPKGFLTYLSDNKTVAFPLTMIDKITPRPSTVVQGQLESLGFEHMDVVVTEKQTHIAPFVNAEVCEYLVIEDNFPNGRPQLEAASILFTDRETVNRVETMKVTTCLNPLHTALAVTGCVLGYSSIAEEMRDPTLVALIKRIAKEGLRVVTDPGIIDPNQFVKEVLEERFPNPNIPDTPQRIATDTSLKVGIRFGETIKKYVANPACRVEDLVGIPLAIATWLRYLLAVDWQGNTFALSPDPQLELLQPVISQIAIGDITCNIQPILANKKIFGIDLYEAGVGKAVELYFVEMLQSYNAIRLVLEAYVGT